MIEDKKKELITKDILKIFTGAKVEFYCDKRCEIEIYDYQLTLKLLLELSKLLNTEEISWSSGEKGCSTCGHGKTAILHCSECNFSCDNVT